MAEKPIPLEVYKCPVCEKTIVGGLETATEHVNMPAAKPLPVGFAYGMDISSHSSYFRDERMYDSYGIIINGEWIRQEDHERIQKIVVFSWNDSNEALLSWASDIYTRMRKKFRIDDYHKEIIFPFCDPKLKLKDMWPGEDHSEDFADFICARKIREHFGSGKISIGNEDFEELKKKFFHFKEVVNTPDSRYYLPGEMYSEERLKIVNRISELVRTLE